MVGSDVQDTHGVTEKNKMWGSVAMAFTATCDVLLEHSTPIIKHQVSDYPLKDSSFCTVLNIVYIFQLRSRDPVYTWQKCSPKK